MRDDPRRGGRRSLARGRRARFKGPRRRDGRVGLGRRIARHPPGLGPGRRAEARRRDGLGRRRSAAELTFAPSGGMIAAPTPGLPEVIGGVRNWDYRYVWTRDASFSVSAFIRLGFRREAAEFLRFLHEACDHGQAVRVLYAIDGPLPDPEELTHLRGYRESLPVRLGNDASEQDQFEIYGELLVAIAHYVDCYGVAGLCEELVDDLPAFVTRLAEAAITNSRSPDQGIWELKGEARQIVHTKGMCWVALDRAIHLSRRLSFATPSTWDVERERIGRECLARGWNAGRSALTMEYDGAEVDMSVLRLALLGFVDPHDPRMRGTVDALRADLGQDDLYRRYRFDDGLPRHRRRVRRVLFLDGGDPHRARRRRRGRDVDRSPAGPRERSRSVRRRNRRRDGRPPWEFPARPLAHDRRPRGPSPRRSPRSPRGSGIAATSYGKLNVSGGSLAVVPLRSARKRFDAS